MKDTFVWAFGTAFIMIYRSVKVKDWDYFKEVVKDMLKWIIILEFITDFYVFSLPFELFLIPFLTIIATLIAYSEAFEHRLTDSGKRVAPFLQKLSSYIGIFVLSFVFFKTISQTNDLITIENFKSLRL